MYNTVIVVVVVDCRFYTCDVTGVRGFCTVYQKRESLGNIFVID